MSLKRMVGTSQQQRHILRNAQIVDFVTESITECGLMQVAGPALQGNLVLFDTVMQEVS